MNKVDTATLANDDPSIATYAVNAYTPSLTRYGSTLVDCHLARVIETANYIMVLYVRLTIQGENNPIVHPTGQSSD